MNKEKSKNIKAKRRHGRVRAKINGTNERPRLSVFRSNKGMYLQIIDDAEGVTLASASPKEIKGKNSKVNLGFELGKLIAKKAQDKKIGKVVFDKGCYKYHGRIEAAAKGAREGGLKF
jgi:large subunit ribosomal protein L18